MRCWLPTVGRVGEWRLLRRDDCSLAYLSYPRRAIRRGRSRQRGRPRSFLGASLKTVTALRHHRMVSLTDSQLAAVMAAPRPLPAERRDLFLQRVGAMLRMRGRFTDSDLADVVKLATAGLTQQPAA
jgi:hypothetical protein